jgi:hypothetical protein
MQLTDANEFPNQAFADKDFFSLPFDLTVAAHHAHLVLGVIPGVLQALRPDPWRGL